MFTEGNTLFVPILGVDHELADGSVLCHWDIYIAPTSISFLVDKLEHTQGVPLGLQCIVGDLSLNIVLEHCVTLTNDEV